LGSPVLDFLVTGDASNIDLVKGILRDGYNATNNDKSSKAKRATKVDRLQSHVDEGMPQQAVCNWVMCEKCAKWRRLPFHVDVDALPEKFYCKDNIWNPESNSCDAPEDLWQDSEKTTACRMGKITETELFVGGKIIAACHFLELLRR